MATVADLRYSYLPQYTSCCMSAASTVIGIDLVASISIAVIYLSHGGACSFAAVSLWVCRGLDFRHLIGRVVW